ncbi:MAG TPA: hypothetical protein VNC50_14170, partial [Planctomycetia bacterium]|nr:hypothetical protein [Planctomycetia bacterium]
CWIVDRAGNVRPVDEKSADPEIRKRMALLPGAVVPLPSSILAREVADGACIAYLRQGYQSRTYRRHPLVNSLEAVSADLADWLGARKPFRWLDVVLSPSGAVIWRSDVHYFRFLLLPAAGISLVLAALSFRRYRVHRRRLN